MKLHLPKILLAAVIASVSFSMKAQAGSTGWENSDLFIYKGTSCADHLNQNGMTGIKYENDIVSFESIDAIGKGDIRVQADCDSQSSMQVLIGTLTVDNDATLKVDRPFWGPRTFDALTIDNLTVDGRANLQIEYIPHSGDVGLTDEESSYVNKVVISSVTGSLGKVAVNAGGNLTIGTDSSNTVFSGTITNSGTLTVNGAITISNELSLFDIQTPGTTSSELTENGGLDGYATTTGNVYYLVDNADNSTCTFSPTTATYNGESINLTKDSTTGDVTFSVGSTTDTVYRVNTKDVVVGGTGATANTARATAFDVIQGRTVTIADASDSATTGELLAKSSGAGNVILAKNATIQGGQQTQMTGKLTINDGVTLTVGAGSGDRSNISSFKGGVELAGGSLMINGAGQEVNSLTVSKASILGVANQNSGHQTYTLTGTTQLNADLEYTNSVAAEHGDLVIKNLSGSGTLSTNGGTGIWGANALKVEKLTEYTGSIKVDGGNRDNYRNYVEFGTSTTEGDVTTKTSAFSTLKGLELTNKAYATVHSTANSTIEKVVLNNGSLQYASDGGSYTYSLGDVTSDGASSISMDAGKAEITKLTLNSGQLSVTGSLTIGELVLDLSKYTDMAQTYTLVTTTGEGATVGLTTAYSTEYNGYTASVSGNGTNSLTLSFSEIVAPDTSITTTVTGQSGIADGMLTLNVAADLTNATQVLISGISDSIMADILGLSGLPENGMVGITLAGADGSTFTAEADQQIGFQGNDGVSYYFGEQVGNAWQYQVAYIPEPASATLGLAAFMMLAARRRRKA